MPQRRKNNNVSPEFKAAGHKVLVLKPEYDENGLPETESLLAIFNKVTDVHFNPNDSMYSIEGITSPDGRVFGKMGHAERIGSNLYANVPGEYDIRMFEAAVKYFK